MHTATIDTPLRFQPSNSRHFFEVETSPVFYQIENSLFFQNKFPNKKIIVNKDSGQGISIVPENFLPVNHQDAFYLGNTIFEILYGVTPQVQQEALNPSTTDYSVDFISERCKIVFDRDGYRYIGSIEEEAAGRRESKFIALQPNTNETVLVNDPTIIGDNPTIAPDFYDEYYPFVRVSNYLRSNASFYVEVGYYRSRCSNGMLYGRKTKMVFKSSYFVYDFKEIKEKAIDHFLRYKENSLEMAAKLWRLLLIPIPKAKMRVISFDIFEAELLKKSIEERRRLQVHLTELVDKYVFEIGENLNAAVNVATDFSKALTGRKVSHSSIQNLASLWMNRVTKKSFNLEKYLLLLENKEEFIVNAKQKEEEEEVEMQ